MTLTSALAILPLLTMWLDQFHQLRLPRALFYYGWLPGIAISAFLLAAFFRAMRRGAVHVLR